MPVSLRPDVFASAGALVIAVYCHASLSFPLVEGRVACFSAHVAFYSRSEAPALQASSVRELHVPGVDAVDIRLVVSVIGKNGDGHVHCILLLTGQSRG